MSKLPAVIYYDDERNNEFSTAVITPRRIDGNWVYLHTSPWKRFTHFFWYRMVATPLAFFYLKHKFHHKVVGREKLPRDKKTGYFLFGNHTQPTGDAVLPSMLTCPKDAYTVVHPNNVSMPVLGRITPSLGALPLPDDLAAARNFAKAIETRVREGCCVVIYPEAHIWPYYTGIRPFPDDSFSYPIRLGAPVFCFTNTYEKRRHGKKPRIVTYIDGPFFPDPALRGAAARRELRDRVYRTMCGRAASSNIEVIHYAKKELHE